MKKLILILVILVILLTACAPEIPLISPVAISTPTLNPSPTPAPAVPGFNPLDGTVAPALGLYNVGPLTGVYLQTYTNKKKPDTWYPATFFAEYNTSSVIFTLADDFCPISGEMGQLIAKLNSVKATQYLESGSDGIEFNGNEDTVTFPLNEVNVIAYRFSKATGGTPQWWAEIQTIPCTNNGLAIDPTTIPPWLLQHQSDMTYNGGLIAGLDLMGFDAVLPLVSRHDVWVPFTMLKIVSPASPTITPTNTPSVTPSSVPPPCVTATPVVICPAK